MKKSVLAVAVLISLTSCKTETETKTDSPTVVDYPKTKTVETVDTYFDVDVQDPYRWLEDDRSTETGDWVKAQNQTTQKYLQQISYRDDLKKRLETVWNYEKIGAPFVEGDYTYFYKNDGLQNQSVVYRKKNDSNKEEVFLDPNTFSKDGTVSLDGLSFSKDSNLLAYNISEIGRASCRERV